MKRHALPVATVLTIATIGTIATLAIIITSPKTPAPTPFRLEHVSDSLYYLGDWPLPYPVYQMQTGDVDGDGFVDAMVGVIKSTRFHPESDRRLFIFKQVNGKVRPMWLGSRLGRRLIDFRFTGGRIRALEQVTDSAFSVAEYRWHDFGMEFERFIMKNDSHEAALKAFKQ